MRSALIAALAGTAMISGAAPQGVVAKGEAEEIFDPGKGVTLRRFSSDSAFRSYMKKQLGEYRSEPPQVPMPVPVSLPAPPPSPSVSSPSKDSSGEIVVTGQMSSQPNLESISPVTTVSSDSIANAEITNNQTVGVDEGGIVKQIGRYLIVLQDGRLFSVDLGQEGGKMEVADRVDVYRNTEVAADWYDEMLVLEDRILVTAYNYNENASEMTVFRMDPQGKMTREGRYLISSDDYYSTDNYATRLVGDTLVFYTPKELNYDERGRFGWPRIRRAKGEGEANKGDALIGPTDVYAPVGDVEFPVVHTISVCPLKTGMDCRSTAFVGPPMREFYVSPDSAYLWVDAPDGLPWGIDYGNLRRDGCAVGTTWRDPEEGSSALLYRLPLDGSRVGAVGVDGNPADQFSFDSRDGRFRALLDRSDGCLSPEQQEHGRASLLDIPLSAFGPTARHVSERAYTTLPTPTDGGEIENRFIGNWLVYGSRESWSSEAPDAKAKPNKSTLFTVPMSQPKSVKRLTIPHNAIRIERAGNDAVVTGYRTNDGLSISYIALGTDPRIGGTTILPKRFESEGRSHAFNAWVKPDGSGVMGIPTTVREWRSGRGWSDSASSDLSFIAIGGNKSLTSAGELSLGDRRPSPDYACAVSCVDWYGNSRPIFTGGRIFALMGTDIIEGEMRGGRIREMGRADLTGQTRTRRGTKERAR